MFKKSKTKWISSQLEFVPEPFDKKPLEDCTLDQLQAKIEFLERKNLLLKSENEALEMYAVKQKPELLDEYDVDVSWMPYTFNNIKPKLAYQIPKVVEEYKRRMTNVAATDNESDRMSNAVLSMIGANYANKISINHLAFMVQSVVKFSSLDFKSRHDKLIVKKLKLENEIDNVEETHRRIMKNVENYRKEILVAGLDKISKRIPAEKYEWFAKRRVTAYASLLNNLRLKTVTAKKELKLLRTKFFELKNKQGKVTLNDCKLAQMKNEKLTGKVREAQTLMDEIKVHKDKVLKNYGAKKKELEKFELSLDLPSLDAQINRFKNKGVKTSATEKLTTETVDNKESSSFTLVAPESEDDKFDEIEHCMKLKNYIHQSDKDIKSMEKKLDRQNQTLKFLLKQLRLKKKKN